MPERNQCLRCGGHISWSRWFCNECAEKEGLTVANGLAPSKPKRPKEDDYERDDFFEDREVTERRRIIRQLPPDYIEGPYPNFGTEQSDECEVCGHPLLEHAKVTDDLGDYLACVLCDGVMCAHIDGEVCE